MTKRATVNLFVDGQFHDCCKGLLFHKRENRSILGEYNLNVVSVDDGFNIFQPKSGRSYGNSNSKTFVPEMQSGCKSICANALDMATSAPKQSSGISLVCGWSEIAVCKAEKAFLRRCKNASIDSSSQKKCGVRTTRFTPCVCSSRSIAREVLIESEPSSILGRI